MNTNTLSRTTRPHLSLNVSDVTRSVDFYTRLFGSEPTRLRHDYAKFEPESPALNFSMLQSARPIARGGALSHLGIEVPGPADVAAARARLVAAGLEVRDEPDVTCCYAKQAKLWVSDPDGNEWEVFTVLAESAERDGPGAGTACCA